MIKYIIVISWCLFSYELFSQPLVKWDRSFGGSAIDDIFGMAVASDDHFIVLGTTRSPEIPDFHGNIDIYVAKVSYITGQKIWEKSLGSHDIEIPKTLTILQDGNILITGETFASVDSGDIHGAHGSYDIWLVKLNNITGDTMWSHCYGGSSVDRPSSTIQHSDGKIYVVGNSQTINGSGDVSGHHDVVAGKYDVWLIKVNPDNGNLIWAKCYGGASTNVLNGNDRGTKIIETLGLDSNIVFSAVTNTPNNNQVSGYHLGITAPFFADDDIWICKIDTAGNLLNQRCIGGNRVESPINAINTSGGNIAVMGITSTPNNGDVHGYIGIGNDFLVSGIDVNTFDTLWTQTLGGDKNDVTANMIYNELDSSIWFFANIYNPDSGDIHDFKVAGGYGIWVAKINSLTGDTIWTKSFGSDLGGDAFPTRLGTSTAMFDCNGDFLMLFRSPENGISGDKHEANNTGQTAITSVLVKVDPNRNVIWSKTISSAGPRNDDAFGFINHPKNGFLVGFNDQGVIANPPGGDKTADSLGERDLWTVYLAYDTLSESAGNNFVTTLCSDTVQFFTLDSDTDRTPAATYTWNFGDPFTGMNDSSNERHPEHIFSAKGTYTVMLVKEKECMVDTLILNVTTSDTGSLEIADTIICESNSAMIAAPVNGTYLWSTGENTPSITVSDTGIYWLQISNGVCVLKDSFEVLNYVVPLFDVTPIDTTISSGEIVQIVVTHLGDSIWWNPELCINCDTMEVIADTISNFIISISDSNGCTYFKTVSIYILDSFKLFMPNAFKIDESGSKVFEVQGVDITKTYSLMIKNKRGETIFQSTDINIQWNGYCDGTPCPQDVYTYYLKSGSDSYTGNITLLR